MPDSAQERTEAPTPRRREEARARGQIGRSTDLTAAVTLLGALMVLNWTGRDALKRLLEVTRGCLSPAGDAMIDPSFMSPTFISALRELAAICLPILLVVVVLAIVTNFMQVGVLFTFQPLMPSLERLNPISGFKRIFSARSVVHLLMGIAKMSFLTLIAAWTLKQKVGVLASAGGMHHLGVIAVAADLIFTLGIRMAIALLVLAILDYVYQRYKTENEMKMTKEELREELKRMDGDPKIKLRRRQIQQQLAMRRIKNAVPKADVIITNPTEFAVAIQYDAESMNAPKVVAKGADLMAKRIREVAIEHGVPIVERKPLARALYATVEIGQEIPSQFYKAVAEILAYVYELAGKGRSHRRKLAASVN